MDGLKAGKELYSTETKHNILLLALLWDTIPCNVTRQGAAVGFLLPDENSFSLADEKLDFDMTLSPARSVATRITDINIYK